MTNNVDVSDIRRALGLDIDGEFLLAVRLGNIGDALSALHSGGANLRTTEGPNMYTALHLAARYAKKPKLVKELVRRGLDIQAKGIDFYIGVSMSISTPSICPLTYLLLSHLSVYLPLIIPSISLYMLSAPLSV